MNGLIVSDIMTRDPVKIGPNSSLLDCAKVIVKKRVGSLPIVEKNKLVGFITQKDILWALIKKSKEDLSQIRAVDISPKKIATTKPSSSVKKAFEKMKKTKFNRLPVIHNGEFVGVLTIRDILNFSPEFHSRLNEFALIREEAEKLERLKIARERPVVYEGICEECGEQGSLVRFNGLLVCNSCKD